MRVPILSTFLSLKISPSSHCKFLLGKKKKKTMLLRKSFILLPEDPLLKYFFHQEILLKPIKMCFAHELRHKVAQSLFFLPLLFNDFMSSTSS